MPIVEERLTWLTPFVSELSSHLRLDVPRVVQRDSKIAGMSFDVFLTSHDVKSVFSAKQLATPELRLSTKALTEFADSDLRFEIALAMFIKSRMRKVQSGMTVASFLLAIPIIACVVMGRTWLAVVVAIAGLVGSGLIMGAMTGHLRRQSLMQAAMYVGEPTALLKFLQKPKTTPVWFPQFMKNMEEKRLQREISMANQLVGNEETQE